MEAGWNEVSFPALSTDVYQYLGYMGYEYAMSVGLFAYDTSLLQSSMGADAFAVWLQTYDGWSIGSNLYIRYY